MQPAAPNHPTFSVVIPTKNRPHALGRCLEGFASLDYPSGAWELVVVNDGGEHTFDAVPDTLRTQLPMTLLTIEPSGPAAARNRGVEVARGDFIVFTDDDCVVTPDWLSQFEQAFDDTTWHAFGGQSLNPYPDRPGNAAWHFVIDSLYLYYSEPSFGVSLLVSNNAAYRREVYDALGGFDESFRWAAAEDRELSHRLLAHGYRQGYLPSAHVYHYQDSLTIWRYFQQQFRYGRGGYYFHKRIENQLEHVPSTLNPQRHFLLYLLQRLFSERLPPATSYAVVLAQVIHLAGVLYEASLVLWQELTASRRA